MSMYGTYWGFSLPLSTLAALVARRPSVWPLASTTNHLRSIFLPLGTKVPIALLPSLKTCPRRPNLAVIRVARPAAHSIPAKTLAQKAHLPTPKAPGLFYPRPNKSVRVRTAGASPQGTLAQLNSHKNCTFSSRWPAPANATKASTSRVRVKKHRPQAQHRARSSEYPNLDPESTKTRGWEAWEANLAVFCARGQPEWGMASHTFAGTKMKEWGAFRPICGRKQRESRSEEH